MADRLLELTDFSLVWGPLELPEPAYSFADDWTPQVYTPNEIADAMLSVPGVRLKHPAIPGWERWAAEWAESGRNIQFDMIDCDFEADNDMRPGISLTWGGSKFEMH